MLSSIRRFIRRRLKPTQLIVISFALVIFTGAVLLSLPAAVRPGRQLNFIDALFTATSATCVTGLTVVDTGTTFSVFGQIVILSCIQIGGLGLMTFTTVFMVLFGQRLAIADRIAVQESFHHTPMGKISTLIKYIFIATFITEMAGAIVLAVHWARVSRFDTLAETLYMALFHSVSAFCNAGFALFPDNLIGFQRDWIVQLTISSLIVAGGLGFLVGLDIKEYIQHRFFFRYLSGETRALISALRPRPRLSLHTKLVVVTTAALLVVGTVSFYLLERGGLLSAMKEGEAWLNAYFLSVTPRTAGFNTVDYMHMSGAAVLCTMVLMFIGASPGSTGGGIKTSSFGLLVGYSITRLLGQVRLNLFNRTVPQASIDRGAAVVVAAIALIIVASSALMITETYGSNPAQSQGKMVSVLFETISAFGTVGLSIGQTAALTDPGKLIISLVMFMGRAGPLTLALAISIRQSRVQYHYAEENVMVG
jgi:trk system potassium uptake protein TrkH